MADASKDRVNRSASRISEVLKSVFANLEDKQKLSKEDIEAVWKNLVGEVGFKRSRPVTLRKQILTVFVDSSGWMQTLTMKKRNLLKGLKRALGKDRISEIRFKIGEF